MGKQGLEQQHGPAQTAEGVLGLTETVGENPGTKKNPRAGSQGTRLREA